MTDETDGTEREEGTSGDALPRRGGTPQAEPESSDSLRTFGAVVQALREHAGLSRAEFGLRVGYSKHTIASVEQGRRMPDVALIEAAEALTGETGALRSAALHLSREKGLAAWFRQWAQLEAKALTLCTYECRVVPGLLQTEAYARAVTLSVPPLPTEEELNERITARLARQEVLSTRRKPLASFNFILEQAVLERRTGGLEVMREQLDHLLDVTARHWNVELQVMPLQKPFHAGLDGPLQLLETPEHRWYGYSEGQKNGRLISDRKEISVLQQRYAKLRSQALCPEESRSLVMRMRGAI
ncbi:helix-turn-helix domain-containing protein [Streptomyces sp. SID4919]|uniref:helix-turn-helix domain-containing protein n=1 Tax=unclassified Streptomyces TaxID=2593676 RepID=UPI000823F7F1|nr:MULTISPECIES: helix-turn-helix transcriptional regulator [unclassified Streptomyces]MYY12748.1 helix-turn-helix domain-containing protein [Streptomyces sp. SID4919]SCK21096.1 Predicted transcription factor, homolog of eukaryotic MBF1 [Streptomyces sp. AmelKG-E11A]